MDDSVLTISRNLKFLMTLKKHDISESELARQVNIPRATINRIIAAKSPNLKAENLKKLANYFSISVDALMGRHNQSITIPILAPDQAHQWQTIKHSITQKSHPHWVSYPHNMGHLFAYSMRDQSLAPYINSGDTVIIDGQKKPKRHDLVAFYFAKQQSTLLRYLDFLDTKIVFRPVDAKIPVLELSEGDKMLGTARQIIIDDTP